MTTTHEFTIRTLNVIDGKENQAGTRHEGYGLSQKHRKRIEEPFGWAKTVGGMAQTMYRGVERVRSRFIMTMAAGTRRHAASARPATGAVHQRIAEHGVERADQLPCALVAHSYFPPCCGGGAAAVYPFQKFGLAGADHLAIAENDADTQARGRVGVLHGTIVPCMGGMRKWRRCRACRTAGFLGSASKRHGLGENLSQD